MTEPALCWDYWFRF